jgi:DNA-binding response OmpR family regulator
MARILVIDDDEIVNGMIVQMLTEAGFEAEGAHDGAQGLKLFDQKTYDLIITDIVMPGKEGIETIGAIRKKSRTLPIIAISGGGILNSDRYLAMALEFGANQTIQKPFGREAFLKVVRNCLSI